MTLNWGHKLIGVFLVFGAMMSFLVYRCIKTNYDLVSKEYYKDEIAYQQVIDGSRKAASLSSKVTLGRADKDILIHFPGEMNTTSITGEAWFYCAVDARRDKKIPLKVTTGAEQVINGSRFLPGNYIVKISWNANQQHYYSEQTITIK